jgi:hypothetical protein
MKLVGIIGTAVLSLTLGAVAPVYAQQEEHGQDEHAQQEDKDKKVQPDKPAQQEEKHAQPEEKRAQQEKPAQQDEKHAQQEKPQQEKPAAQHEQQAQRAEGNHGRIPDDRYKANFGRQHTFRVNQGDYNNHRFQYGGYWFGFAAPWPNNWLYTQDVFVVDIGGVYYLCNPVYPGVNVELIVQL